MFDWECRNALIGLCVDGLLSCVLASVLLQQLPTQGGKKEQEKIAVKTIEYTLFPNSLFFIVLIISLCLKFKINENNMKNYNLFL